MKERLAGLRRRMAEAGLDVALLVHPRDLFYYANTARPAMLVVGPSEEALFVRRGLDLARREATVARVEAGGGLDVVAAELAAQGLNGGCLGVELDVIPARLYLRIGEALPGWELADVSPLVLAQRQVKEAGEIEVTARAAAVADAGHAALARGLRPGLSELELAAQVEAALRRAGHEAFQPLRYPGARGGGVFLMAGERLTVRGGHGLVITGAGLGPATPYGPSHQPVRPGDLVVLDIGAACDGYTADVARTFVVGKATAAQQALFDVAVAAEEAVLSALQPGVSVGEVYAAAAEVVARGAPPYFAPGHLTLPGFAGHGVGVELDEPPVVWEREKSAVEVGWVLAVEIEVNAPAAGLMAKLEDTVVVETDGSRLLGDTPRRLIETALPA